MNLHGQSGRKWLAWSVIALIAVAAAGLWARQLQRSQRAMISLENRLGMIMAAPAGSIAPCATVAPTGALVVLALGQSNAGNHGTLETGSPRIALLRAEGCTWATDPLPGATGQGGSVWSRLPAAMAQRPGLPPVLLSVLAVDATSVSDWTRPESPLPARLRQHMDQMVRWGYPPDLVLWHQGEADARLNTTASQYRLDMQALASALQRPAGSPRKILLAHSTICRSEASDALNWAVRQLVASDPRFGQGPDLDQGLRREQRSDGCHLNGAGLAQAAALWADAVQIALLDPHLLPGAPP